MDNYSADSERYNKMVYRRCGKSGLKVSAISLGLWRNFGSVDVFNNSRQMMRTAFDAGITNFDLANNYGPEFGSAESNFGEIMDLDFRPYRDEMTISTKAGFTMWPGPFGDGGSRKYIIASCNQSLKRMKLDYVDIFYHHRPDPETPIEESMLALEQIVRSGKALYAGISNYHPAEAKVAIDILNELKVPFILNQVPFNIFNRTHQDNGLFDLMEKEGTGSIIFSPLAQGLLTNRYLNGIPTDSRAARNEKQFAKELAAGLDWIFSSAHISAGVVSKLNELNNLADERGQTLSQMAIAWVLNQRSVCSALIGASRPAHITDICACLNNLEFTAEELATIDRIYQEWQQL